MAADNVDPDPIINEIEKEILTIWREVLGTSEFTVNDDFADLGGDSLAAMVCISRLKSAFGIQFGIEEFFWGGATIRAFTSSIEEFRSHRENTA